MLKILSALKSAGTELIMMLMAEWMRAAGRSAGMELTMMLMQELMRTATIRLRRTAGIQWTMTRMDWLMRAAPSYSLNARIRIMTQYEGAALINQSILVIVH